MKPKYAKSKDRNHDELAAVFEAAGCSVVDASGFGDDFPDLVVGRRGRTVLVEVKNPKARGKLRPGQVRFMEWWRGAHAVVENVDDCLAVIKNRL